MQARAYQTIGSAHREVDVTFVIDGRGEIRFAVGPYDASALLVIDAVEE